MSLFCRFTVCKYVDLLRLAADGVVIHFRNVRVLVETSRDDSSNVYNLVETVRPRNFGGTQLEAEQEGPCQRGIDDGSRSQTLTEKLLVENKIITNRSRKNLIIQGTSAVARLWDVRVSNRSLVDGDSMERTDYELWSMGHMYGYVT